MPSFFSFGGNKAFRNTLNNGLILRNDTIASYNSAAIGSNAFWNGGLNFTSVGTNGKSSYYGTFDQTGLIWEWCDSNATTKVIRGGDIAGFGGFSNKYDSDKTRRYTKTVAGGDTNPPSFLDSPNRAKGKPQDQDWGGRIVSLTNPLNLDNYVTVGDINNSNDTTGYGGVSYSYKISRYLLTNNEYCAFLNLKAASDSNKLYSTQMSSERVGGINRSGSSGSYTYTVKTNMGNKPVYFLSWFSLARYCNWLHNGKASGSTETGAYTLNNALTGIISKNAGANYYIPTENEWYKAAYYKGGSTNAGYWSFATQNNAVPTPVAASLIGDGTVKNVSIKPISAVGSNVSISGVSDTIYNTTIGLTYQQVSSSGITKITPVTQNDPKLPVNFSLSNNLAKYNISTTSARSGNIDLCFTLPSSITSTVFNKTKIFHTDSKGVTKDITITSGANAPNYSTRTICGRSTSFSDFHIVPSNDVAAYPVPTSLSGIPGNGKIDLSWSMSDTTDIFDYDVKFSADSGNSWTTFQHSSTTGNVLSIDSLVNNTAYVFSVAAVGVSGVGDYSTTSSPFTPVPSAPDVVAGVSAVAGTNRATVSWNVPNNNGSDITSYSVQYSTDNGSSWSVSNDPLYLFADDVSTTRSLTVTNLYPISHTFRVAAINSIGSGNYSSSSDSVIISGTIPDCDLIIGDTITISPTPTPSLTPTSTTTPTPTVTPSSSVTPTATPTNTTTPTPTTTITPTSSSIPATPTPTVTQTPSASPAVASNGIIIQSSVSSTPRALIGGGVTYNPTFINSNYNTYFNQVVDRYNIYITNGKLPYNTFFSNDYAFYTGYYSGEIRANSSYSFNFVIPTVLTKYRLWNAFSANIINSFRNGGRWTSQYGYYSYLDTGNQTPQGWKIQGSNDDYTWTDVDVRTSQARLPYATSNDASTSAYSEFTISSPQAYKSYRFVITAGGRDSYQCGKGGCSYDWQLGEIQLWGYESPTTSCALHGYGSSLPFVKYINSDSSLRNIPLDAGYVSPPVKDTWSDGCPGGWGYFYNVRGFPAAFYKSGTLGHDPNTFKNNGQRTWDFSWDAVSGRVTPIGGIADTGYLSLEYPIVLTSYKFRVSGINKWTIYGSNNFSSWTTLDDRSNANAGMSNSFSISNPQSYKYFKIEIKGSNLTNSNKGGSWYYGSINDIQLIGYLQ